MKKRLIKGLIVTTVVIAILILLLWLFREPIGEWIAPLFFEESGGCWDSDLFTIRS